MTKEEKKVVMLLVKEAERIMKNEMFICDFRCKTKRGRRGICPKDELEIIVDAVRAL